MHWLLSCRSWVWGVNVQVPIEVRYDDHVVGEYFADLIVADSVLVEVKAARGLSEAHEAQLLNYLKATPYEEGFYSISAQNLRSSGRYTTIREKGLCLGCVRKGILIDTDVHR